MTTWTRVRFILGIVFVVIVVGMLVLYLNNAMSTVHANKATLLADTTTVGVDYPGLIVTQNVREGDRVTKDQILFAIKSPQLAAYIANGSIKVSALPFTVDAKTGNILVKSSATGSMGKIHYQAGAYVPGGVVLATINSTDTLYIAAHYRLSPPDYTRVEKGGVMNVTFPDNSKYSPKIYNMTLENEEGKVDTIVKARIKKVDSDFHFPVGTPVEASLKLSKRTWYQNILEAVQTLFKPNSR